MTIMRVQVSPAAEENRRDQWPMEYENMEKKWRSGDDTEEEGEEEAWSREGGIGRDETWKEAEEKRGLYRKEERKDPVGSGEVEEEQGEEEGG